MSDGMSDARDYGPSLSKHGPPIVSHEGKPVRHCSIGYHACDEVKALALQIREKDEWIKALETRIDTQTKMLADAGLIKLREPADPRPKDWHCAKCGKPMQFKDGMCMECFGGDPGE